MTSVRPLHRTNFRSLVLLGALLLVASPAAAQMRLAARIVSHQAARGPKAAVETPREIVARYATGYTFVGERLYEGNGDAFSIIPVWTPEPAVILSSGQLKDGTWRIQLRTQSGLQGYIEVAHPNQLSHFLQRTRPATAS